MIHALKKIADDLASVALELNQGHPIDPADIEQAVRQLLAQVEMLEQGIEK